MQVEKILVMSVNLHRMIRKVQNKSSLHPRISNVVSLSAMTYKHMSRELCIILEDLTLILTTVLLCTKVGLTKNLYMRQKIFSSKSTTDPLIGVQKVV